MKFRVPNTVVASGLMVSALIGGQQHEAATLPQDNTVDVSETKAFDSEAVFTHSEFAEEFDEETAELSVVRVNVAEDPEWDTESQERFEELVERESFDDDLNEEESLELKRLEQLRARSHPSRTYEEMLADYELNRVMQDTIRSLENFIEYASKTFPHEAKTNRG